MAAMGAVSFQVGMAWAQLSNDEIVMAVDIAIDKR